MFVLLTDHKSKKNPSKSETEQGCVALMSPSSLLTHFPAPSCVPSCLHPPPPPFFHMGLRGMSTHGFQLTFAAEESGQRHVETAHYEVFYEQTSEQTLPEAMSAVQPNRPGLPLAEIGDNRQQQVQHLTSI